ncbi:hypothetical protein FOQG_06338 [Fusarium oxysporum f. sp. raphani 54005]|uniref:Uncharacterized protein n=3 Tax=Fusarium oxysporum TaxID=5507 RepID=X0CBU5_FUSOX|nr:hypothetical protein FOVG_08478 [Fusarium oxysporum f. sp. pisi HDV247]EXK91621.1 hypothetical protein FOQG_06338 [Fusarium oxysporum f. sp. raphani 54005]EXL84231.1 hypothetical protein FOPG_03312 [Fusarium oxysporum f. sp. conglutinans race 2 54008]
MVTYWYAHYGEAPAKSDPHLRASESVPRFFSAGPCNLVNSL